MRGRQSAGDRDRCCAWPHCSLSRSPSPPPRPGRWWSTRPGRPPRGGSSSPISDSDLPDRAGDPARTDSLPPPPQHQQLNSHSMAVGLGIQPDQPDYSSGACAELDQQTTEGQESTRASQKQRQAHAANPHAPAHVVDDGLRGPEAGPRTAGGNVPTWHDLSRARPAEVRERGDLRNPLQMWTSGTRRPRAPSGAALLREPGWECQRQEVKARRTLSRRGLRGDSSTRPGKTGGGAGARRMP